MVLAEMLQAKRGSLRPTVTIVRPLPVCCTGTEEVGLSCLGGEIESERTEDEKDTAEIASACAQSLRSAAHAVVYTGAGVSTSTGISDYRGPNGVWTSLATGRIPDDSVDVTAAVPSYSHMCIAKLIQEGYLKSCISTNLDALHYKSGLLPLGNLAELHGSLFCERCSECGADAPRPFPIRRTATRLTGRQCQCDGNLTDSGIDFGQSLSARHVNFAKAEAKRSDFSLVIGTSLRVRPASDFPVMGAKVAVDCAKKADKAQLCIVNKMDTPLDSRASARSYNTADMFFFYVMKALELEPDIPPKCDHLTTATQMKRLAVPLCPPSNGHYVGEEEKERQMSAALSKLEAKMISQD